MTSTDDFAPRPAGRPRSVTSIVSPRKPAPAPGWCS